MSQERRDGEELLSYFRAMYQEIAGELRGHISCLKMKVWVV